MSTKIKNKGEVRYIIALERIHNLSLNAFGNSFLWSKMDELALYALSGKLSSEDPCWEPEKKDLYEIDYGSPKGIKTIDKEHKKKSDRMYGGELNGWGGC
jgi:uncharacterized protein (DUF488 family)